MPIRMTEEISKGRRERGRWREGREEGRRGGEKGKGGEQSERER